MRHLLRRPWERLRYGPLLSTASRSAAARSVYEQTVAGIELRLETERTRVARRRIEKMLACEGSAAADIYRSALLSEAREEADTSRLVRGHEKLDHLLATRETPAESHGIFITLHYGSPILAFLYLRVTLGIPVRAIGRALDRDNPLSPAKLCWGKEKVAWLDRASGTTLIPTDVRGTLAARDELLAGRSLFAAIDVPADVVGRAAPLEVLGTRLAFANGLLRIAELTRAPLIPFLARSRGGALEFEFGEPIRAASLAALTEATERWLSASLRAHPGEWWLWPFVREAETGTR